MLSKLLSHPREYLMIYSILCRGRGPLKSTMDVINAAKKISEAGIMLDKLAKQIADQVLFIFHIVPSSFWCCFYRCLKVLVYLLSPQTFKKVNEFSCNVMQQTSNPTKWFTRNQQNFENPQTVSHWPPRNECFYRKENSKDKMYAFFNVCGTCDSFYLIDILQNICS